MNAITKTPASKAPAGQPFRVANIGGGVSNGVVSRQWFARPADERFLSLDALHEAVASRRDRSTEKRATTKDLRFKGPENPTSSEELNDLWIETGDGERAMTHWTFGQIAGLAKAPASYLRGTCENRILWGVEGFQEVTMRHSKYAPDRFIEEIRPALAATNRLTPPRPGTDEHKAWSAVHRAPPGPDRWRFRSSTFDGIADAMADQWGGHAECGRAA